MNRIKGKLAMVTGASAGIGQATAVAFARQGVDLILSARRLDRLKELERLLTGEHKVAVHAHTLDVRDREAVIELGARLQTEGLVPDILVNNAGLSRGLTKIHEGEYDDWDEMIDTNVKGLLNVTRVFLPMMVARNSGHVINIGSVAGHMVYPGGNVYNATKFAVRALGEAMNIDLVGTHIRVSNIDPGAAETEFSLVRFRGDKTKAKAVYNGYRPLAGEDVAEAVVYVANAPEHVNIADLVIMATAQRNPYVIHRDDNA